MTAKKFKILGKQRHVKFGLKAIMIYCDKMGGDVDKLDVIFKSTELEQINAICTLVWAAMVAACELYGDDFDFTLAQVTEAVGEMSQSEFDEIMTEFKNSRYMGRTIAEYYYTPVEQAVATGKAAKKKA